MCAERHASRGGGRVFDMDPVRRTSDDPRESLRERAHLAGKLGTIRQLPLQHGHEHGQIRRRHRGAIFRVAHARERVDAHPGGRGLCCEHPCRFVGERLRELAGIRLGNVAYDFDIHDGHGASGRAPKNTGRR